MTCYHPVPAYQTDAGEVRFDFGADGCPARSSFREFEVPCGRCRGCRLVRARNWAVRCMHERQMADDSCFLTLTYRYDYVPSLVYRDFQLFMKKLRRVCGRQFVHVRFFAVGEYGDQGDRAHFHALLFGSHVFRSLFDVRARLFPDRVLHSRRDGVKLYRSSALERLWPHGFGSIGDVTFQSAAYVARYCCKKVTGPLAVDHYKRVDADSGELVDVVPEFAHMSLRPAIGRTWFDKYYREVYDGRDGVVVDGKVLPSPKRYDAWLNKTAPALSCDVDFDRYLRSELFALDCTPERLLVREAVREARYNQLRRAFDEDVSVRSEGSRFRRVPGADVVSGAG